MNYSLSSPRTWGCFQRAARLHGSGEVFPTHVGVFLLDRLAAIALARLPHARGGVSPRSKQSRLLWTSSPRTWGCF